MIRTLIAKCLLGALIAATIAGAAAAQSVADFYKGRQVSIVIGSEAGAGFDAYGRLVARHMGKYIPGNPNMVPLNKPGAGSLTMVNSLVNAGPFDGSTIGAPQSSAAVEELLHIGSKGGTAAKFKATELNWLGSASQDVFILYNWKTSKVKSFDDLQTTEMLLAASGPNTDGALMANALDRVFGTKIKLITGYQTSAAGMLAMERGEVDANAMAYSSVATIRPEWMKDGSIRILAQMGMKPQPGLDNVPFMLDRAKSPEDRAVLELIFAKFQMGRPYFVPPGVPKDRVAALRGAFDKTMADPTLLAEADKMHLEVRPVSGADVQAMVESLYKKPPALIARARDALGTE
ncbi:MAG TPA: tripartite tricarboxylate transporter substrate-binding protein [Alphaproteobacteria bacterium]|jgi:tripartite-type tricarboxylate transporter receptor subunit TctC|nr:tripartite tricarboxylate transporter substrate-binding protein [Alphaproteobacteria bacterium]